MTVVGSLCSGYAGLEMGIARLLGPQHVAWHTETDPAAAHVLNVHSPDVPNLGDITRIDWRLVEPVDLLAAGIPCQAVSEVGPQRADEDPRWLWQTGARQAIGLLKPRVVVFENVQNLASIRDGELWQGVLEDFQLMNYEVVWTIYGACDDAVQGSHHRHRIFAVARRTTAEPGPAVRLDRKSCEVHRSIRMLPTPRAVDGSRGPASAARASTRLNGPDLPQVAVNLLPFHSKGNSPARWGAYTWAVERWEMVHGRAPAPSEPGPRGGRRLTAGWSEWMMGLPVGYVTDHVERSDALRLVGNGVMPQQAEQALRILDPGRSIG